MCWKVGLILQGIAQRLKNLRKEHRWNQTELGAMVGVSTQVVSNWERNYSQPSKEDIYKLAQTFQVSTDYLLGLSESRFIPLTNQIKVQNEYDLLSLLRSSDHLKVGDYSLTEEDKILIKDLLTPLAKRLKELS